MAVERTAFSLNLSTGEEPFPYPRQFQWTKDNVMLGNSSGVALGYPGLVLHDVSRADSGQYSLSAATFRLDNPSEELASATGSFQLNVLCKFHRIPA